VVCTGCAGGRGVQFLFLAPNHVEQCHSILHLQISPYRSQSEHSAQIEYTRLQVGRKGSLCTGRKETVRTHGGASASIHPISMSADPSNSFCLAICFPLLLCSNLGPFVRIESNQPESTDLAFLINWKNQCRAKRRYSGPYILMDSIQHCRSLGSSETIPATLLNSGTEAAAEQIAVMAQLR
jgi:hypothetical protein